MKKYNFVIITKNNNQLKVIYVNKPAFYFYLNENIERKEFLFKWYSIHISKNFKFTTDKNYGISISNFNKNNWQSNIITLINGFGLTTLGSILKNVIIFVGPIIEYISL